MSNYQMLLQFLAVTVTGIGVVVVALMTAGTVTADPSAPIEETVTIALNGIQVVIFTGILLYGLSYIVKNDASKTLFGVGIADVLRYTAVICIGLFIAVLVLRIVYSTPTATLTEVSAILYPLFLTGAFASTLLVMASWLKKNPPNAGDQQ
ncbi:MAG: hypothetical protein HN929_04915 [Chloroflexi bacterium]|jgi:hypothetical protein|nr:hypothetical protein [Chloroflexota bacterium]MBT7080794.1 hypothetical protein [Chloroflexota bacterium]MBT7289310.1 hypothetical protein [Chloroflexota bacterium]